MATTENLPPSVESDLILLHPPAFFDFRECDDVYFPYLSTSGDVPITPLYEYFPLGFKTLQRFLGERGHAVNILNVATLLLKYPQIDFPMLLKRIHTRLFGIDLHWMVHVQGSLEIARLVKAIHPDIPVIFGGISSTYYARELICYPFVDMVMRGYDTHEPMAALMDTLKRDGDRQKIPNLLWKTARGDVSDNGFSHKPRTFSCGIDWTTIPQRENGQTLPIREILSLYEAGCAHNCGWCGGSREAFRAVHQSSQTVIPKTEAEVLYEFQRMREIPWLEKYHFYVAGAYNRPREWLETFIARVAQCRFKSVSYEQFSLTPEDILCKMALANERTTITLSPDSHDLQVARLAGRGVYTPAEMEQWIEKALSCGIYQVEIWYFIGLPGQDERSVLATVDYCGRLLEIFKGKRVTPLLCPMIPFLDPGSTFFEKPAEHGYRLHYRTLAEHCQAMRQPSLIHRINYDTRWLSRADLVSVSYRAMRRLFEMKGEVGFLPGGVVQGILRKIDDALSFTAIVHSIACIEDQKERAGELAGIGAEIRRRNREVFFCGVANQAFPINREIGSRWFDEILWDAEVLERSLPAIARAGDI